MKHHDIKNELRMLFGHDVDEVKQEKHRVRVCNYVAGSHGAERLRRIIEIFGWLNARLLQNPNQSLKDAQDAFADRLMKAIIERLGFDVFYEIRWVVTFDPCHGKTNMEALLRCAISVYRVVGENLEQTMAFALDLLERFGRTKITFLGPSCVDGMDPTKNLTERDALTATVIVRESAIAPASDTTPSKLWMLRLLERVKSDRAVADVWRDIVDILQITCTDRLMDVLDLSDYRVAAAHEDLYRSGAFDLPTARTMIALPGRHHRDFIVWCNKERQRNDALRARCERLASWFSANEDALIARMRNMIEQIATLPRRGLRPLGFDHVDVDISILWGSGVRGIVFRPEGYTLPDTGLEILVRKVTPHLFRYEGSFEAFDSLHPLAVEQGFCADELLPRKLLKLVIVDVLHRIIVGERPLREKPQQERGDGGEGPTYPIRPHVRRLQPGQRASDEAKQRGQEAFGYHLPEGITFVRAHYSHGRMTYDLPTTAFAEYGDEDLFDLTEKS